MQLHLIGFAGVLFAATFTVNPSNVMKATSITKTAPYSKTLALRVNQLLMGVSVLFLATIIYLNRNLEKQKPHTEKPASSLLLVSKAR